jgi:hypothetical protein
MSISTPAYITVQPAFFEPEIILPYAQASGAFDLIDGGAPRTRLGDGDLSVYIKRMDIRTQMEAGTMGPNQLPGVAIAMSMIQTPTYLLRVRAEYDHHDTAAAGRWDFSLPEAYRLGMRQGHFQLARNALLYGFQPQNGEGLLNAAGAFAINLPPDSSGHTTISTYDNGELAFFITSQFSAMKTRTNQLGIGREFTICGPQRLLSQMEYQGIVQLVQFQRIGAGSESTAGVVKAILMTNGDKLLWTYDDTLIGKGAGGTDAIVITMPKIEKPKGARTINTNVFAEVKPGNDACTLMYCDKAAPVEITSPLAGGATDVLSEWRVTSGWAPRPEAVTIISAGF